MRPQLCLAALLSLALLGTACGSSLTTTDRGTSRPATPAYLVGVTDSRPTRAFTRVSVSVATVDMDTKAPNSPDASVIEAMKKAAAARGAKMVWVERSFSRWQRRFYGWGLVWEAPKKTGVATCSHAEFKAGVKAATDAATQCFARLKRDRPNLAGSVQILFEVDAWGGIRNAAPAPSSSRDTQVHACAMLAVYRQNYGAPPGLSCRAKLEAGLP